MIPDRVATFVRDFSVTSFAHPLCRTADGQLAYHECLMFFLFFFPLRIKHMFNVKCKQYLL